MAAGKQCVRCGYLRKAQELAPETECPSCGVIYARVENPTAAMRYAAGFAESPRGLARAARNAGRMIYQIDLPLSRTVGHSSFLFGTFTTDTGTADASGVLEQIEQEGWRLINASYVFRPTGTASREKIIGSTEKEAISGEIIGIYLFRPTEGPPPYPAVGATST